MLRTKKMLSVMALLLFAVLLSSCRLNVFIKSDDSSKPVPKTETVEVEKYVIAETETEEAFDEPFYGVWCLGSKEEEDARDFMLKLREQGFNAELFITTDWSNLNSEMFYVVTADTCNTEQEAKALLKTVKAYGYEDAYVKYSGDKIQ